MSYNVDIDEADVAVLSQNLNKSKELFNSISLSLNNISTKASTASVKIKPIMKDVNRLNYNKKQIDQGINLLNEVSSYASKTSQYESILNNSIDLIGLKKFLDTLIKSKKLLIEMKQNIKKFSGILINFENLIDKSQMTLISYFKKTINKVNMIGGGSKNGNIKTNQDIFLIINYFYNNSNQGNDLKMINDVLVKSLSSQLVILIKPFANECKPVKRNTGVPYERGTNGISKFNEELNKGIKTIMMLLDDMEQNLPSMTIIEKENLMKQIIEPSINEEYPKILETYLTTINFSGVQILNEDLLILEIIESLTSFETFLNVNSFDPRQFSRYKSNYELLISKSNEMLKQMFVYIESKILGVERLNENNIPEITVELISKIRRLNDYRKSLYKLIQGRKLGSWLNVSPPLKFISVYTSVLTNSKDFEIDENNIDFLLSSYLSDLIDAIMINIEINLKNNNTTSDSKFFKKSNQGYQLIKNTILIESIVNRSNNFYQNLGNVGIERINKLKNRFLKIFLDDWNYASYIIIRDMTTITTTSAMNSSGGGGNSMSKTGKERDQIKELFRNFNESFEEALKNYEKFKINDINLRNYLSNEIKKLIVNAYFKLYDKYAATDFTKNKAKYVKYDKKQFENILSQKL